jgi:NADP-dependent 3-hydroxy acid dehydrogenase YdfG
MDMLLEQKTAVIYGAGGAIGGAVASAFAREGARVFLASHTGGTLEALAQKLSQAGGVAEAAEARRAGRTLHREAPARGGRENGRH